MKDPRDLYRPLIEKACAGTVVPPNVLEAMVKTESNFDVMAKSASNALGLCQLIYRWHKRLADEIAVRLGYQPHENVLYVAEVNLEAGARHLAWCYTSDGSRSWSRAVRKYFSGSADPPPGFVDGQGTSSDQHIAKFEAALKEVEAYRAAKEPPMAGIRVTHKFIPPTNKNYPDSLLNATGGLWVTIHETGNTGVGASAASEARFSVEGQGGESGVSYHFAVDHLGAYQMLALNRVGYHAGDGCNSRSADLGCFASVAIETVVGDGNKHKAATRANLITLIAMILRGDQAIEYGGTDPARFSVERIAPHQKWSSYRKNCPTYMLNEGYFPKIKPNVIAALAGSPIPEPVPVKPLLAYPAGLDKGIATMLFGSARGTDGVVYGFNESGSISKLWLENGKKVQRFPKLSAVQIFKDSETAYRKYFIFADGSVIWHTDKTKAAVLATPAQAA